MTTVRSGNNAGPFPVEDRQAARVPTFARAAMCISRGLPAFPRDGTVVGTIVVDVSLRGVRLLYDEQLFPREEVCIWLPGTELHGEVARCRRLSAKCYEAGVRLDAPFPSSLLKAAVRRSHERPDS
jgi:hypothetical protein